MVKIILLTIALFAFTAIPILFVFVRGYSRTRERFVSLGLPEFLYDVFGLTFFNAFYIPLLYRSLTLVCLGRTGALLVYHALSGRFAVEVTGKAKTLLLKPENLRYAASGAPLTSPVEVVDGPHGQMLLRARQWTRATTSRASASPPSRCSTACSRARS